jgi:hypothetical protein
MKKRQFRRFGKGKTIMTNANEELNLQELDQVSGGNPALVGVSASAGVGTTETKTLDGGNAGGLFLLTLIGSCFH